jgi:hypothetical protein
MRRAVGLLIVAVALTTAGIAAARVAEDLSIAQAHALARQYAPDVLLPRKLPTGISRVAYLQGMSFTPGIKSADLGMQFHGRTASQFQLFFWRGRLRNAIVRAMTVTYSNPQSKYLVIMLVAGRRGRGLSYLIDGSTTNVVDDYICKRGRSSLSVIVKRLGGTPNPWSKPP